MADRHFVLSMAQTLSNDIRLNLATDGEKIEEAFNDLKRANADLADTFSVCVTTGTFGAFLRWPESAALFEEITARIAADPKTNVDVAVTTSRYRKTDFPYAAGLSDAALA